MALAACLLPHSAVRCRWIISVFVSWTMPEYALLQVLSAYYLLLPVRDEAAVALGRPTMSMTCGYGPLQIP